MSCEDFPCCGHESGCCPSFDEDGRQLDMKCTCGASVPLDSRNSICDNCLDLSDESENDFDGFEDFDDMDGDFDSGMTSAGYGCDEDYGYFGDASYGCDEY